MRVTFLAEVLCTAGALERDSVERIGGVQLPNWIADTVEDKVEMVLKSASKSDTCSKCCSLEIERKTDTTINR